MKVEDIKLEDRKPYISAESRKKELYFVGEVLSSGTSSKSLHITFPAWLRNRLKLKPHDVVEITIKKVL